MLCGDRIHFTSFEINNWWRLLATCFCLSPSLVILRFQYVRIVQISCPDSRQSEQVEHFYGSSGTPTLTSHRACLISKFVIECPRVILIQGEPPSYVCCFLNPLTIYIYNYIILYNIKILYIYISNIILYSDTPHKPKR